MKTDFDKLFESFDHMNVMVIGDVMVDSYLWGKVERISPEAPVPVLSVHKKEDRLGGAANVALNIQAMGANPILCSVIGADAQGYSFIQLLKDQQISSEGIIQHPDRVTTVKTRAIGHHQHLLRIDEELDEELDSLQTIVLFDKIRTIIGSTKIDVLIFEDYDKGVITPELIEKVVNLCRDQKIPVVVDPKKKNFAAYQNVTLFKPNLKELKEGLRLEFNHLDRTQLHDAAGRLKKQLNASMVMITLSEHGVYVQNGDEYHHVPAHVRSIADVSGAGDTVISIAALGLAGGLSPKQLSALANLAGGLVCEKVGVVPINKTELLKETGLLNESDAD